MVYVKNIDSVICSTKIRELVFSSVADVNSFMGCVILVFVKTISLRAQQGFPLVFQAFSVVPNYVLVGPLLASVLIFQGTFKEKPRSP